MGHDGIVVGFDLDDTLIAEYLFIRSGIRHIAGWVASQLPKLDPWTIIRVMDAASMRGENHYSALEQLLAREDLLDRVDMNTVVGEFRNHRPDPGIYHLPPSMETLLSRLKAQGISLALVTDGRSATQRNKIDAAGLMRFFASEDIYISGETGHEKTSPESFLAIMEKHPEAGEFHYVGDNPAKDFIQPLRLGWNAHQVHPFPRAIHAGALWAPLMGCRDSGGSEG